jgi:hypothetical protein
MLEPSKSIGRLSSTAVQTSLIEQTIDFVWECLIPWRNDPDRPSAEGEEELNAQFHNFLQSRANKAFPMVLFQHEQRQEGRRRVDLSAKPVKKLVIEGVTYTKYQPILVIEGKRLPAPNQRARICIRWGGAIGRYSAFQTGTAWQGAPSRDPARLSSTWRVARMAISHQWMDF